MFTYNSLVRWFVGFFTALVHLGDCGGGGLAGLAGGDLPLDGLGGVLLLLRGPAAQQLAALLDAAGQVGLHRHRPHHPRARAAVWGGGQRGDLKMEHVS